MTVIMYDLAGADGRRFSPFCWRTRMALAHKDLACEARAVQFTEIAAIAGGGQRTVPVIEDGGTLVADSSAIADYLETTYPAAELFPGSASRALSQFILNWTGLVLHAGLFTMVVKDIHDHLDGINQAYFRENREQRLGKTLEEAQAGREERLPAFRRSLAPLRATVSAQPFLGGEEPVYADYVPFAGFQWARTVSDFRVLEEDDPVWAWLERCRDLHGGLARSAAAYY